MEKLFGIDISRWQGDMSIEQARNERGVRFAIIKAAGADDGKYKDSKFENYYAQCKAIGLPVGAYYYGNAKSVAEAEAEAEHFLSVIAGKQFEFPIYYDVEGNMLNNSRETLTDIVIAFCDKCEKAGLLCRCLHIRFTFFISRRRFETAEVYSLGSEVFEQ